MAEILQATAADFHIIQGIAYKTWPATYGKIISKEQLNYMLDLFYSTDALEKSVFEKGHQFLLAQDGDDYLGFACYENSYLGKAVTRIHKLYVLPQAQGKGIGKLLLDKIEAIAKQKHSKIISLNVNRQNAAQYFYLKLGFKIAGEENVPLEFGYLMEDYIMEKSL